MHLMPLFRPPEVRCTSIAAAISRAHSRARLNRGFRSQFHSIVRSKSTYQYRPLQHNETRLLVLHPGTTNDPLRCSLEDLETIKSPKTSYTAVSYSWNEVPGTTSVECDGSDLQITRSAFNALRRLRRQNQTRRVWIDGLCINQQDQAEKEVVVKRMRDIYSSATEVVIWLGEADAEVDRYLDDYACWKQSETRPARGIPYDFISLLKRPWFTRKWVLQEAILAQQNALTVVCGDRSIPWGGFDGFARILLVWEMEQYIFKMPESYLITQAIRTLRFIDESRNVKRSFSLFDVLMRTRYTDASNVTDYIAAVLGLANDWDAHCGLNPSYRGSNDESSGSVKNREFVNFATWDVQQNRSIRVLAYASGPKKSGGLPSWVPDWTIKDKPEPFSTYADWDIKALATADGDETPFGSVIPCGKQVLLAVKGCIVDAVKSVAAPAPHEFSKSRLRHEYDQAAQDEVGQWLRKCLGLATNGTMRFQNREDFSQFAVAISIRFRLPRSFGAQYYFKRPTEKLLDYVVAAYLFQMTGEVFLNLEEWDRLMAGFRDFNIAMVEETMRRWAIGRRFCRTAKGEIGFIPADAMAGDKICLIRGHGTPYLIREHGDKYLAVGECYFDNFMSLSVDPDWGGYEEQRFVLV